MPRKVKKQKEEERILHPYHGYVIEIREITLITKPLQKPFWGTVLDSSGTQVAATHGMYRTPDAALREAKYRVDKALLEES